MNLFAPLIAQKAQEYNLPLPLVNNVIQQESGFNPGVVSSAGARGLMQLMPATARGLGFDPSQLFDPATNIAAGTKYLAQLQSRYAGDPDSAYKIAAAYNAGPGRVPKNVPFASFFSRLPAETRNYVQKVVGPVEGGSSSTAPQRLARAPRPIVSMPSIYSSLFSEPTEPQSDPFSSLLNYLFADEPQPTEDVSPFGVDPVMLALQSFRI